MLIAAQISQEAPAGFGAKIILQDRPEVIEAIPKGSLPTNVETMVHNFFTPQPVKSKCMVALIPS